MGPSCRKNRGVASTDSWIRVGRVAVAAHEDGHEHDRAGDEVGHDE
jgi:hypothetical protein